MLARPTRAEIVLTDETGYTSGRIVGNSGSERLDRRSDPDSLLAVRLSALDGRDREANRLRRDAEMVGDLAG